MPSQNPNNGEPTNAALMEAMYAIENRVNQRVDAGFTAINEALNGTNTTPGIKIRLDRIEQNHAFLSRVFWFSLPGVLGAGIAGITAFFKGLLSFTGKG